MDEKNTSPAPLKVGDRVNWLRSTGGWGFVTPVAAVVLKIGSKRVKVRVAVAQRGGTWQVTERWVDPSSLKPRVKHVPEVDES